jgi:CheY-like chemotaxis protein
MKRRAYPAFKPDPAGPSDPAAKDIQEVVAGMAEAREAAPAIPRVLLVEESLPYRRVIREALMAFRHCEVDDAPSGERAFELALQREYSLFLFSLPLPDMTGDMLDRLLSKVYPMVHAGVHTSPPVIFLIQPTDAMRYQELQRDVRVRGSMPLPPKLDVLLSVTATLLPERQGGLAFPPSLPPPLFPPPHVP